MQLVRSNSPRGRRGVLTRLAVGCFTATLLLWAAAATVSAATLDRIRETGVVKLGYLTAARPFSYRDESGMPAGYAVALCQRIVTELKQTLAMPNLRSEFLAVEAETRFDAVRDGHVDLLCGGGTPTLKLRAKVSFSIPIFPGGVGALVRKDAPARLRTLLAGDPQPFEPRWRASLGQVMQKRTFAVVPKSPAAIWLEHALDDFDLSATIDPIDTFDVGVDRVAARRADVMFADREILLDAVRRSPAAKDLMVIERKFTFEPIAFALERSDEDFRLFVDTALSRLYRTTWLSEVYAPVFGKPDDDTLNYFLNTAIAE